MTTNIPDGIYYLHPEGSAWQGVEFARGEITGHWHEANMGSHDAAGDRYAGAYPSDDDAEVPVDLADRIVREAMREGTDPECVVVTRKQ